MTAVGRGEPLRSSLRRRLEPLLGIDLGQVRVHTDDRARRAAKALGARAFAIGRNIWLGPGESPDDERLLAHEATHVAQQADLQPPIIQRQPVPDAPPPADPVDELLGIGFHLPQGPVRAGPVTATGEPAAGSAGATPTETPENEANRTVYEAMVAGRIEIVPPLTLTELRSVMGGEKVVKPEGEIPKGYYWLVPLETLEQLIPYINEAFHEFEIDSPAEKALYVAHMLQETMKLTKLEEGGREYSGSSRPEGGTGAVHATDKTVLKYLAQRLLTEKDAKALAREEVEKAKKTPGHLYYADRVKAEEILQGKRPWEEVFIWTKAGSRPEWAFRLGGAYFQEYWGDLAEQLETEVGKTDPGEGWNSQKVRSTFESTINKINARESADKKKSRKGHFEKALKAFRTTQPFVRIRELEQEKPVYSNVATEWAQLMDDLSQQKEPFASTGLRDAFKKDLEERQSLQSQLGGAP